MYNPKYRAFAELVRGLKENDFFFVDNQGFAWKKDFNQRIPTGFWSAKFEYPILTNHVQIIDPLGFYLWVFKGLQLELKGAYASDGTKLTSLTEAIRQFGRQAHDDQLEHGQYLGYQVVRSD